MSVITAEFHECLAAAEADLGDNESVLQFRLGAPIMGRADYITRYKAYVGTLDPSNTTASNKRTFLVTKSSNTGVVALDKQTPMDSVPDVWRNAAIVKQHAD